MKKKPTQIESRDAMAAVVLMMACCLGDIVLPNRVVFPLVLLFSFSQPTRFFSNTHMVRLFVKSRRFDIYRLHNTSHKFLFFYRGNKTPGRAAISVTLKGRPASTFRHTEIKAALRFSLITLLSLCVSIYIYRYT